MPVFKDGSTGYSQHGMGSPSPDDENPINRVGAGRGGFGVQQAPAPRPAGAPATQWYGGGGWTGGAGRNDFTVPGAQGRDQLYGQLAHGAMGQTAPQVGPAAQIGPSGFAGQQDALGKYLMSQATGQGPSLAQQQYQQASDAGFRQQLAMAAGARPGDAAMAARLASQNIGTQQQGLAAGLAQAGTQERMAAAGQAANVLGQGRQQDYQQGAFNAGAQNQFGMANAQMQQQQLGMNNDQLARLLALQQQNAEAQQRGLMGYEANQTARYAIDQNQPKWYDKLLGAAVGLAPTVAGFALGGPPGAAAGAALGGLVSDKLGDPNAFQFT
jgi:hypothetical protein